MPWITRCSLKDITNGNHINPENCILIQIVDICMEYPKPLYEDKFLQIHGFELMDVDEGDEDWDTVGITKGQSWLMAYILYNAYKAGYNVLVHCVMGVCRSGGVCEAAESMGFEYLRNDKMNMPNILVKSKIMQHLREINEIH